MAALVAAILPLCAQAQIQLFSSTGNDPGRLRWSTFQTGDYQLIYPRGFDSLATVYGTLLQQYSVPLSASSGFRPNEKFLQPDARVNMTGNLLWSAGADIAVNIQRLVLVSSNFSIGARIAYSGGSAFPFLQEQIPGLKPFYVGAVFNTQL